MKVLYVLLLLLFKQAYHKREQDYIDEFIRVHINFHTGPTKNVNKIIIKVQFDLDSFFNILLLKISLVNS